MEIEEYIALATAPVIIVSDDKDCNKEEEEDKPTIIMVEEEKEPTTNERCGQELRVVSCRAGQQKHR